MLKTETITNSLTPQIQEYIQRWGSIASEIFFDYPYNYFMVPNIEGVIGYRIQSNCAVTFGDPVCSLEKRAYLVQAFQHFCEEKGLNAIYMVASKQFAHWSIDHQCCSILLEVGEGLFYDPQCDPRDGPKGNKIRNMISHAKSLGLTVSEYLTPDETVEQAIQQTAMAWLQGRKGSYVHLSDLQFFDHRMGRRWFYIVDRDRMIGAALICRREASQGWMLKYLTTLPEAPRGTSEFLTISILDTLKNENCLYFNYGLVPAMQLGEIRGLSKFSEYMTRSVYKVANWAFHFEQHRTYWQKYHPKREPFYLLFANPSIRYNEIQALTKSLHI